jgi:hypothetical protein
MLDLKSKLLGGHEIVTSLNFIGNTTGSQPNVRFGSKADIEAPPPDVRFTPKSGHQHFAADKLGSVWER